MYNGLTIVIQNDDFPNTKKCVSGDGGGGDILEIKKCACHDYTIKDYHKLPKRDCQNIDVYWGFVVKCLKMPPYLDKRVNTGRANVVQNESEREKRGKT